MIKNNEKINYLLENYIGYLYEQGERIYKLDPVRQPGTRSLSNPMGKIAKDASGAPIYKTTKSFSKFIGTSVMKGAKTSLWWGLLVTLGLAALWKGLNFAFSKAYRKCGFEKGPHKVLCMSNERIKILNQQLIVLKKAQVNCGKTKDPNLCKKQIQLEIQKRKNRIQSNQRKIQPIMGKSESLNINMSKKEQLQEILPAIVGVAAFTASMMATDWALQKAWRTALAIFSTASRQCGVYKTGPERTSCMAKYKLLSLENQLKVVLQMKAKCSKTRDQVKCNEEMNNKIDKIKTRIQMQKDAIIIANKEVEALKREEQMKLAKKNAAKEI